MGDTYIRGAHDLMYFFCLQEVGLITGGLLSVCVCGGGLISGGLIIKSIFCLPEDRLITGGLLKMGDLISGSLPFLVIKCFLI